jgi:hypothetical protein
VIDLVPDKEAVFAEIDRVLRRGGRLQLADVVIHHEVSEDHASASTCGPGELPELSLEGEHARILVGMAYTEITEGDLVDTYARSSFEDTRRKAAKFGAMGSTIRATRIRSSRTSCACAGRRSRPRSSRGVGAARSSGGRIGPGC